MDGDRAIKPEHLQSIGENHFHKLYVKLFITTMSKAKRILDSPNPPSSEPGAILVETERLIIRRLYLSDAEALAKCINEPDVLSNLSDRFAVPYLTKHAEEYLSLPLSEDTPEYPTGQGIFLKPGFPGNENGTESIMVGNCGTHPQLDVAYRTWHLGYFIAKPFWGKGYATEAISAFVRFIFATWPKLLRVEAHTYASNEGSQNVLRKVGFTQEGRLRSNIEKNGVVMDDMVYGILRDEVK